MTFTADTHSSEYRVCHIVYSFALYFVLITAFFWIETAIFGPEVLEDKGVNPLFVLTEDLVTNLILSSVPILMVTRMYRAPLTILGLTGQAWQRNLLLGVSIGVPLWGFASLLELVLAGALGPPPPHPSIEMWGTLLSPWVRASLFVSVSVIAPIAEEIYFRGFVYTVLRQLYGKWVGVLISSVIFAAVHPHLAWAIPILVMGIFFALLFDKTKSLLAVGSAHAVINIMSLLI